MYKCHELQESCRLVNLSSTIWFLDEFPCRGRDYQREVARYQELEFLNTLLHVEWTKYIKQAHVQTDVVLVPEYTSLVELTGMVSHAGDTVHVCPHISNVLPRCNKAKHIVNTTSSALFTSNIILNMKILHLREFDFV